MDLETFIIAVFCLVDDLVRDLCRRWRLRRRGPAPALADSEVLTIEAVGEFLGLDTDRATPTGGCTPTSAGTSATSSPACGWCTGPRSCGRRRTSGR